MDIETILNVSFWGNTGKEYLIAFGVFVGLFVLFKFFRQVVLFQFKKLAQKTQSDIDDVTVAFFDGFPGIFFFILSLYCSLQFLTISPGLDVFINGCILIVLVFFVVMGTSKVIRYFIEKEVTKQKEQDKSNISSIRVMGVFLTGIMWVIAILLVLSNLGVDITSLVAGLGIGGIAIAFALQRILEDVFASFSIYLDKPFEEGDFIVIGADSGTVKHVGLKTTRITTLQGQELVVSNRELTSTRVNNYKKMCKRRVVFTIGVEYETPQTKLKKIPALVEKVFDSLEFADLDRVHFKEFGPYSLNYEIVYFVKTKDYGTYMDVQQDINLNLKGTFEKEKIVFAFPTTTVHVVK